MDKRKNDEPSQPSPAPWNLKLDGLIRDAKGNIIVVCYNPDDAEYIINCVSQAGQQPSPIPKQLPPDPERRNGDRAAWAATALKAFREATGTDEEDSLGDLLTDLMHWSDREGFDFDIALERARGHYKAETGVEG